MKKKLACIVICVVACVALAGLAACGGSGSGSGAGASASGDTGNGAAESTDVYVLAKTTSFGFTTVVYERDAHGNMVGSEVQRNGMTTSHQEFENDEDGYMLGSTLTTTDPDTGKKSGPYYSTSKVTLNGDGLASSLVAEGSKEYESDHPGSTLSQKITYEYYASGRQKSVITEVNGDIRKVYYDERGYISHYENGGSSWDVTWEFDSEGKATGYTASSSTGSESAKYTCTTDSAGNITEIRDESGTVVSEYEYQKIDNPSKAVKSYSSKPFQSPLV